MRTTLLLLLSVLICCSCSSKTGLNKEFLCKNYSIKNTKTSKDFKNKFELTIPLQWKTNLFYDNIQSSIYAADTTRQLTETVLIDATQVNDNYTFDKYFMNQLKSNDASLKLKNIKQGTFQFNNYNALFAISKGKKGNYKYQILNIFIQISENNSYHLKTEVYGKKDIDTRLCKGINILNTIKFNGIK